jgi:hypothetical protein
MAALNSSPLIRLAIWMAHTKRCAYCGDPIQLRDLEIDHILPESLENDPEKLERLITEYGLSTQFGINSALNFLPSHCLCNSRKTNRIFNQSNTRYFLEIAKGKLDVVERLISALELQVTKERILGAVKAGIESGKLEMDDITHVAYDVKGFPLSTRIDFQDGPWDGQDRTDGIEELLDRPILFGGTRSIDGVEFVNGSGGSMAVRTCREYRAAKAARYYAPTTFAMKMEGFVSAASAILDAVSRAQLPAISYLKSPHVGVADLHLLPKDVLSKFGPDQTAMIEDLGNVSLRELTRLGKISIIDVSSTRLDVVFNGFGTILKELLRADLDGDGLEEILVQHYTYAVGGTLGFSFIFMLRRNNQDAPFEFELWPPRLHKV